MTRRTQEPAQAPTHVQARGWWAALRRARPRIKELNIALLAAGVAFWATLSVFPALFAVVMVYGLVANPQDVAHQVDSALSGLSQDVKNAIGGQLTNLVNARSHTLSIGLVISLVVALWAASSGAQTLMKALSTAFEQQETRGFVALRLRALLLAVGGIVIGAVLVGAAAVVPALLRDVLATPWLRWLCYVVGAVLLLALLTAIIALLYRWAPAGRPVGMRWASAGALFAALGVVIFTVAFAVYLNTFANYQKTYGTLAGVVVLMLWLYYSSYTVLVGALVDAEAEREAQSNAPSEPEGVDRDMVRRPDEESVERRLRPVRPR
jgi:membrane protein